MHHMPSSVEPPKTAGQGQRKPRKPRGRGLRTTTGCAVCRRRHMKCDETKPICGPCAKGGRDCHYGNAKSPSSVAGSVSTTSDAELSSQSRPQTGAWSQQEAPAQRPRVLDHANSTKAHFRAYPGSSYPVQTWESCERRRTPGSEPDLGQLPWNQSNSNSHATTPISSHSEPYRWLGLLTEDGSMEDDSFIASRRAELLQKSCTNSPTGRTSILDSSGSNYPAPQIPELNSPYMGLAQQFLPALNPRSAVPSGEEKELWQAPITLSDHEISLFHTFVDHLSHWLDLYDPLKHFSTLVPQLALCNEGLMKAILALSARHLSLKPKAGQMSPIERTEAVQYYSETLQYLQRAMKFESYTRSPDIIATALIVSAYEMIDGAGQSWERHLKGVFWIQRSQDNNGESGGLKQAVWWAWLRQDLWAAYRERRRCFSFWKPKKPYQRMNQYEIASRVVYLLSQSVNYASEEERQAGETNLQQRVERADTLLSMLDEWKRYLTVHFQTLPVNSAEGSVFTPVWINPPAFGAAMQMYHFARILLLIHCPGPGGYVDYNNREHFIANSVDAIGGIAMCITDPAATVISTQALYCAGQYTQDPAKQAAVTTMIDEHQNRTGWPVIALSDTLKSEWSCSASLFYPTPPDDVDMLPGKYFEYPPVSAPHNHTLEQNTVRL